MNGNETRTLFQIMERISTSLALLVEIQQTRLQLELSMTADTVTQLVNAITALIQADVNDKAALATAQTALSSLQAQDAALNDPALQASVDAALAAASSATTAPAPAPAPDPVPVAPNV